MNAEVSAVSTGDQSGSLLQIGDAPAVLASCLLGYSSAGPTLYYSLAKNVASLEVGSGAGVPSWIITMHPSVSLGVVEIATGDTVSAGYSNTFYQTQFKILDFGPGYSANPVRIEVYLTDVAGNPVDPAVALGNTGYLSFAMLAAGVGYGETPI